MSRSKRLLLIPAATVTVALGLALGSVAAVDDDTDEAMASMEPMADDGVHGVDGAGPVSCATPGRASRPCSISPGPPT